MCRGLGEYEAPTGSAGRPVPGYNVTVLSDEGDVCKPGEMGNLVVKAPLPPGTLMTIHNNPDRFKAAYWSQYEGMN